MSIELIEANNILEVLIPGEPGPPGPGVPLGGATGQKLVKLSAVDGDTAWADDFLLASQAQAEAGTDNTAITTSLRVAQAISARITNTLSSSSTTLALSAAQGKVLQDSKAPLNSPAFTGTPTAPTLAPGATGQGLANADFVAAAISAALAGQTPRAAVVVVATTNQSLSGLPTIDGYAVQAGDQVLLAGQSAAEENGPYVAAAGAWSRRADFDTSGEATTGSAFFVSGGAVNGGTTWTLLTPGPITLGTTALTFALTGSSGVSAGNGLSKSGSTLSLAPLGPGQLLVGNGSSVATARTITGPVLIDSAGVTSIAAGAIGNAEISAGAAIVDTKLATISTSGKVANSATTATAANTAGAIVARDGSGNFTAGTITASLNGNAATATAGVTAAISDASTALATTLYVKSLFGAGAAGGVADWNNVANSRAGCGPNLLAGNASNGPASIASTFHPLTLESGSARDGSGDLAQLAIGQGVVDTYLRTRNGGAWSSWQRLMHDGNLGIYTGVTTIVAMPALNIDCSAGNYFTKTINSSDNSTFTVSNVPTGRSYAFTLELTHISGAVTWFANVVWPNGITPSLTTGKTHLFMFVTDSGTSRWRGAALTNYTT